MRIDTRWAAVAAAFALTACNKGAPADAPAGNSAAPATSSTAYTGQDWRETVTMTPEGGFRMGNPDAKVKLVEYASLTCPHCAEFSKTATAPLEQDYIRTGKVSWEYRTFVLNAIDVAASLLARCQGPAPFFKLVEQTYANQEAWVARFQNLGQAEQARISALPEQQQFAALAKAGGLDQFYGARGLPQGKAEQCLIDKAGLDRIVAIRELGTTRDKISGTPGFLINGTYQDKVFDWPSLKQQLDAAG